MARFQEHDGEVVRKGRGKFAPLGIDLWMEGLPSHTRSNAFEVLDESFPEPSWRLARPRSGKMEARPFLTDDFDSYGDVEIWARGTGTPVPRALTTHTSGVGLQERQQVRIELVLVRVRQPMRRACVDHQPGVLHQLGGGLP